jgi:hypothetical protein
MCKRRDVCSAEAWERQEAMLEAYKQLAMVKLRVSNFSLVQQ